jgi:hypothetical protein
MDVFGVFTIVIEEIALFVIVATELTNNVIPFASALGALLGYKEIRGLVEGAFLSEEDAYSLVASFL